MGVRPICTHRTNKGCEHHINKGFNTWPYPGSLPHLVTDKLAQHFLCILQSCQLTTIECIYQPLHALNLGKQQQSAATMTVSW